MGNRATTHFLGRAEGSLGLERSNKRNVYGGVEGAKVSRLYRENDGSMRMFQVGSLPL